MASVNGLRETVDIARKAEERRREKKLQRIADAREEIFNKLSSIYLNEIHLFELMVLHLYCHNF